MKKEQFDAHLLGVINGPITEEDLENENFLYTLGADQEALSVNANKLAYAAGSLVKLRGLKELVGSGDMLSKEEKKLTERLGLLPKDLAEVLVQGRIRLDLLINSPGEKSIFGAKNDFVYLLKQIQFNGGLNCTYAGSEASGDAAFVWQEGGERFAMVHSQFFWYTRSDPEHWYFLKDLDSGSIKSFLGGAKKPYKRAFQRRINKDINRRCEIKVDGITLNAAGLTDLVTPTEVTERIEAKSGWRLSDFPATQSFIKDEETAERESVDNAVDGPRTN